MLSHSQVIDMIRDADAVCDEFAGAGEQNVQAFAVRKLVNLVRQLGQEVLRLQGELNRISM